MVLWCFPTRICRVLMKHRSLGRTLLETLREPEPEPGFVVCSLAYLSPGDRAQNQGVVSRRLGKGTACLLSLTTSHGAGSSHMPSLAKKHSFWPAASPTRATIPTRSIHFMSCGDNNGPPWNPPTLLNALCPRHVRRLPLCCRPFGAVQTCNNTNAIAPLDSAQRSETSACHSQSRIGATALYCSV